MDFDRKKILANFRLNYWLIAEILPAYLLVPAVVSFILFFNDLSSEQIKIIYIVAITVTFGTNGIYFFVKNKKLKKIETFFEKIIDQKSVLDEYEEVKKYFYQLPFKQIYSVVIRWSLGFILSLIGLKTLSETTAHLITNILLSLIISTLFQMVFSFSYLDLKLRKIASTGIFDSKTESDNSLKKPFFTSFAFQTFSLFGILVSIILLFSFNFNILTLKEAYKNQMVNLNESNLQALEKFYFSKETEINQFAISQNTIQLVKQKNWFETDKILAEYYSNGNTYYENNFIISVDSNEFKIVSTGLPNRAGIGFSMRNVSEASENLKQNMNGKLALSKVHLSPLTKIPVILLTAPIFFDNKIIAIAAFPFKVGDFTFDLIKNISVGEKGYSLVITKDLICIAHKDKSLYMYDYDKENFSEDLKKANDEELIHYQYKNLSKFMVKRTSLKYDFVILTTAALQDIHEPVLKTAYRGMFISIICLIGIGIFFYFTFKKKFQYLTNSALNVSQMSKGNLLQEINITSTDEIGNIQENLKEFNRILLDIVKNDKTVSENLVSSSNSIQVKLNDISKNANKQVNSSEKISNSVNKISSSTENVNKEVLKQINSLENLSANVESLTEGLEKVRKDISDSNTKVSLIVSDAAIGQNSLDQMGVSMKKINESSKKINSVMEIITNISDQINLLALNASIEAARAGEHGRGFAVVADEIGKLADKTSISIKDITVLVKQNDKEINHGTDLIENTINLIQKIIDNFTNFKEMIENFNLQVSNQTDVNQAVNLETKELKKLSDKIKFSMNEQLKSVDEITNSVTEIHSFTLENKNSVKEVFSSSDLMKNQSDLLKQQISFFKIDN